MEELNSGLPKTNPSSGREEDLNPGRPDYESSALPLGHAHLPNMTHPERPFFCIRQKCILVFAHGRPMHVENKSYPKITKLGQNGSFINLYHHCKYHR